MKRILFVTLAAAVVLTACGSRAEQSFAEPDYYNSMPASGGAPMEAPAAPESVAEDSSRSTTNVQAAAIERLVLKNADVSIVVADVKARLEAIARMAEEMGGFVVSSSQYQAFASNGRTVPEGSVVIRVPAERLDEALERIKADTVEVQNESRSGQDVTAEYVDLQSRLKNLEAAEAQLARILEEAQDTEDVLNVFNQLTSIREQIEVVKGQIKYYEESAALSAISVRVIAEETIQPIEIAGWRPQGVAREAIQDLIYFSQDFVDFLIRFVLFTLPTLILIAIPLYLIFLGVRAVYRRTRKPNAEAPQAAEKPKAKK
ncbi:MAG: DUF4349 domain-containing protein [Gammaproteobacteria bacterium]